MRHSNEYNQSIQWPCFKLRCIILYCIPDRSGIRFKRRDQINTIGERSPETSFICVIYTFGGIDTLEGFLKLIFSMIAFDTISFLQPLSETKLPLLRVILWDLKPKLRIKNHCVTAREWKYDSPDALEISMLNTHQIQWFMLL